jgi:N-acyl-D-amino-acid deacylase
MTGLPARTFRLAGRGQLAEGSFADLVVFDPQTVIDRATYENPKQFSLGINMVFVNGALSWEAGMTSVNRAGRLVAGGMATAH